MTKIKKKKDPFAAREAAKYDKPVPSREYILAHLHGTNQPASLKELCDEFKLDDEEDVEAIRRRLKAMLRDGQLEQLSKRKYWPTGRHILVRGTVFMDRKNMLWVVPEDRSARIALPYFTDNNVMSGNTVIVSVPDVADPNKPREGKVVEILTQPDVIVTGRYATDSGLSFVVPFSKEFVHDIVIPPNASLNAKNGQIVVVEVSAQHSSRADPIGKIVEILGDERNKNVEIEAAIRKYHLPYQWAAELEGSISKLTEVVPKEAYADRVDLRELPLVTIDGEDARDFDDAVFCMPNSSGWHLYVAIADVSYYVKPDSILDHEAYNRGNSVYFPTRVIPMLPEILSNGLCSLKPDEDRLCMVCEMAIGSNGTLGKYKFYPAVMRSKARLTYNKVAKILDGNQELREEYAPLVPHIENLADLYHVLRAERTERGAIDFETVETSISFGKNGTITSIDPIERNVAHKIIEECMLCANVSTAKFLDKYKIPSLYRNHEGPLEEKLADLRIFLREIGLSLGTGKKKKPDPIDYGRLLEQIKNRPDYKMIQTVLLRSLCQAVYAPDNLGHFGLAYDAYTHFTSPIRRYPDLIVHRQIKTILAGKWNATIRASKSGEKAAEKLEQQLEEIAHHCSITERRADDATRDVIMSLKCQYIKQHVGSVFDGIISGVTRFGLFVELVDYYVDGLVHIASIGDDYYIYDPIHHRLVGERTGIVYSLGMAVKVQVAKVNTDELKIDFNLIQEKRTQRRATEKNHKRDDRKPKKHGRGGSKTASSTKRSEKPSGRHKSSKSKRAKKK
ncbi:MAG TPA: ribonuclease R [Gammaproteobacteria bacterium]|nr:ribonuclease R [Gammaproteobacteria bacterium]